MSGPREGITPKIHRRRPCRHLGKVQRGGRSGIGSRCGVSSTHQDLRMGTIRRGMRGPDPELRTTAAGVSQGWGQKHFAIECFPLLICEAVPRSASVACTQCAQCTRLSCACTGCARAALWLVINSFAVFLPDVLLVRVVHAPRGMRCVHRGHSSHRLRTVCRACVARLMLSSQCGRRQRCVRRYRGMVPARRVRSPRGVIGPRPERPTLSVHCG